MPEKCIDSTCQLEDLNRFIFRRIEPDSIRLGNFHAATLTMIYRQVDLICLPMRLRLCVLRQVHPYEKRNDKLSMRVLDCRRI